MSSSIDLGVFLHYLPLILQAYWILAISAVILTLLPVPVFQSFKDAVRLSAARGKLWSKRPKSLGLLNDLSVPQAWFSHFYAIGSAFCLLLLLLTTPAAIQVHLEQQQAAKPIAQAIQYISLWLFLLHLLRRLLETCCLMVYPPAARMHVIAYMFGLSYYIVAPLSLLCTQPHQGPAHSSFLPIPQALERLSLPSSLDKGGVGRLLASLVPRAATAPAAVSSALAQTLQPLPAESGVQLWLQVVMGVGITLLGFALQFHSHWVLATLAAKGKSDKGDTSHSKGINSKGGISNKQSADAQAYCIPHGGAFEWVSCPHYAGEVIIYAGLTLLTWPHAPIVPLMFAWVVTNLVLAAGATQQWYLASFPSYPKGRRAMIPGVF